MQRLSFENEKCEILVSSCDGYADLWLPFFNLFKKHWPDCPFEISLITEKEQAQVERVNSLCLGTGKDWSNLLASALEKVQTDYVLFMLEDFFLRKKVCTHQISKLIEKMDEQKIEMLRLVPRPGPPNRKNGEEDLFGELPVNTKWRVSSQASIWRKTVLKDLVKRGESAWEFEVNGTQRSIKYHKFYCTRKGLIPYGHHVVERGKWFPWEAWKYKKMNIGCDFSKRRTMNAWESSSWLIKKFLVGLKQYLMK